jgi:hypothetical protein
MFPKLEMPVFVGKPTFLMKIRKWFLGWITFETHEIDALKKLKIKFFPRKEIFFGTLFFLKYFLADKLTIEKKF